MDSQKFNPKKFFNDVQILCGNLSPKRLEDVQNFAVKIGDQSKLNECLEHVRRLTHGLPQEEIWTIFYLNIFFVGLFQAEKYIKPFKAHTKPSLVKKHDSYLKRFKKAVETVKDIDPAPSKFDEEYLLNLAEKVAEKRFAQPPAFMAGRSGQAIEPSPNKIFIDLIEFTERLGVGLGKSFIIKKRVQKAMIASIYLSMVSTKQLNFTDRHSRTAQ